MFNPSSDKRKRLFINNQGVSRRQVHLTLNHQRSVSLHCNLFQTIFFLSGLASPCLTHQRFTPTRTCGFLIRHQRPSTDIYLPRPPYFHSPIYPFLAGRASFQLTCQQAGMGVLFTFFYLGRKHLSSTSEDKIDGFGDTMQMVSSRPGLRIHNYLEIGDKENNRGLKWKWLCTIKERRLLSSLLLSL